MDFKRKNFSIDFAGRKLSLEVSRLAEQTSASVLGRYGDSAVLATVVMSSEDKDVNYLPLLVDYEERFYAAGKIIGSRFMRREGRPSDEAILSGRIIDRTIRPLFDNRMRREVQVVITILSSDDETDLDFVSLISASAALAISDIPWDGPVGGVKMLLTPQGEIVVNPKNSAVEKEGSDWEFIAFVAGTKDRLNMVELEGKEAKEKNIVRVFESAQSEIKKLTDWQEKIVKEIGVEKQVVPLAEPKPAIAEKIRAFISGRLESAVFTKDKKVQKEGVSAIMRDLEAHLADDGLSRKEMDAVRHFFDLEIDALVHKKILEENKRPDGRALDEVRELYAEVAFLPRTHGSALFVRGTTQALAVTTLGPPSASQLVETIEFTGKKRFLLHYNFPKYSVGEIGSFRGPSRRDIGHGSLAGKAIRNLIPPAEEFPYTIRIVSEILSSNGSSSMATVCATSLSLMDAGVPLKKPVAGIAMGLILDENPNDKTQISKYKILTDIQGPEDHYGDMDFKAAGTKDGVTALQMDVKISGVTPKILSETLEQAKKARLHIFESMDAVLKEPRKELSPYAPSILTITIPVSKIGEVIGPGGKTINGIIERTGALSIDIEEDGKVFISAGTQEAGERALEEVRNITREYEIGEVVEGKIVKIMDFGAIVEFAPKKDGMIHVSELKDGFVKNVTDVVKVGDVVRAKIIRVDEKGKVGLSLKNVV